MDSKEVPGCWITKEYPKEFNSVMKKWLGFIGDYLERDENYIIFFEPLIVVSEFEPRTLHNPLSPFYK